MRFWGLVARVVPGKGHERQRKGQGGLPQGIEGEGGFGDQGSRGKRQGGRYAGQGSRVKKGKKHYVGVGGGKET